MPLDDVVRRLAEGHSSKIRRPFGRCLVASEKLASAIRKAGRQATVLRCSDGLMQAPEADRRWLQLKRSPMSWIHYVVLVDGIVIDLTRRQFHPDSQSPHYARLSDLCREWQTIQALTDTEPQR